MAKEADPDYQHFLVSHNIFTWLVTQGFLESVVRGIVVQPFFVARLPWQPSSHCYQNDPLGDLSVFGQV